MTAPNFVAILEQLGWTQARAAATLNVSQETIERWSKNNHDIPKRTLNVLKKYCEIYRVDAFNDTSDPVETKDWYAKKDTSTKIEFSALDLRIRDLEEQLRQLRQSYRRLSKENQDLREALRNGDPAPDSEASNLHIYNILEATPDMPWQTIKQHFIRLSKQHHPDHGGNLAKMQEVTEAFSQLKVIHGQS